MLFFFLCASFALFPHKVLYGAQTGLALCINAVIPSLLPFLLLSNCLIKSNFSRPLGVLFSKILSPVTGLSPQGCVLYITGLIGGYGAGARAVKDSYDNGDITKNEAEALLAFCNNSGPLFVIGTIGITFLESKNDGIILYLIQIITSLICASVFAMNNDGKTKDLRTEWEYYKRNKPSAGRLISQAAISSGNAIIGVCVFVISFSAALAVFPKDEFIVLSGICEVTKGCADAARLIQNPFPFISAMLSWGGLSVHFQTGCLTNGELSLKKYYKGRMLACIVSFISTYLIYNKITMLTCFLISIILSNIIVLFRRFHLLKLTQQP